MKYNFNSSELKNICRKSLQVIAENDSNALSLYQDENYYSHYCRVAEKIYEYLGSIDMAIAGFLHGILLLDIKLEEMPLPPTQHQILQDWRKIVKVDFSTNIERKQILSNLMQSMKDRRNIIPYIISQLDHLDPDNELTTWTHSFCKNASLFPAKLQPLLFKVNYHGHKFSYKYALHVTANLTKFLGLWTQRNTIENAVLYYTQFDHFIKIASMAVESQIKGECSNLVKIIKNQIDRSLHRVGWGLNMDYNYNVRWEWRHAYSIYNEINIDRMKNLSQKSWELNLHRFGYVTITCPSDKLCYSMLGFLHDKFYYRKTYDRDYIGKRTFYSRDKLNTYNALHTVLVIPRDDKDKSVTVRIVPEKYEKYRVKYDPINIYKYVYENLESDEALKIRVYSPAGHVHELPVGSTVLNFAYKVHSDFFVYFDHAIINGNKKVGILHQLENGDEVDFVLSEKPKLIPDQWESKVPKSTVAGIKKKLSTIKKLYYRDQLLHHGKEWITDELEKAGIHLKDDDAFLYNEINQAADVIAQNEPADKEKNYSWWLTQFGLWSFKEKGYEIPTEPNVNRNVIDYFLKQLIVNLKENNRYTHEIEFPLELRLKTKKGIKFCEKCSPTPNSLIFGDIVGGILYIHTKSCGLLKKGEALNWVYCYNRPQYFVIDMNNRPKINIDIIKVFEYSNVDILEFIIKRRGITWSVARIKINDTAGSRKRKIFEELSIIPGINRVIPPGSTQDYFLEADLPDRNYNSFKFWERKTPYHCGEEIEDECFFYGRNRELFRLHELLDRANKTNLNSPTTVYIKGPLKYGKSSLVLQFLKQVEKNYGTKIICVKYKANKKDNWVSVEKKFAKLIISSIDNILIRNELEKTFADSNLNPLVDVIEKLIRIDNAKAIIIALDEAIGLMWQVGNDEKQLNSFIDFMEKINNFGRIMIVWVGPETNTKKIPWALKEHGFRKANDVTLSPLTQNETKQLLEASKLGPIYNINASKVFKKIYKFTAGNPYWIMRIGELMWEDALSNGAFSKRGDSIFYNNNIFEKSLKKLLSLESYRIEDRVPSINNEKFLYHHKMLMVFYDEWSSKKGKFPGLNEQELFFLVNSNAGDTCIEWDEFQNIIEDLRARGTLLKDGRYWKVSSPLLMMYIEEQIVNSSIKCE